MLAFLQQPTVTTTALLPQPDTLNCPCSSTSMTTNTGRERQVTALLTFCILALVSTLSLTSSAIGFGKHTSNNALLFNNKP
jgi:hypothetical protein